MAASTGDLLRRFNGPNGTEWSRLEVGGDEIREVALRGEPDILQEIYAPAGSRPVLAELEANAPAGYEASNAEPIDRRAWLAAFPPKSDSATSAGTYVNAIQLHGLFYLFESRVPLAGSGARSRVLVLDARADLAFVPPADTSGCPVSEFSCRSAVYELGRLQSGDSQALLDLANPKLFSCSDSLQSGAAEACKGSVSGIPRYAFSLDEGAGQTRWVSEAEFRAFLATVARRMANAQRGLRDEFGDGAPAVASFTIGPQTKGKLADSGPTFVNLTWLEGSGESPVRVVVGLEVGAAGAVIRTDATGLREALTGERGALPPGIRVSLWSSPQQR